MTTRSSQILFRCIGMLLLLTAVPVVMACEKVKGKAKPDPKVRVCVVVILASEKDDKVDKKLENIAREVRKMNTKLKGFRLADLACKSLRVGSTDKFDLVEAQQTSITVQGAADKMDRVRLEVAPPLMGKITYSTPCGKFLPIVTPFRTKANEVLIFAVRVQPCQGK